MPLPVLRPLPLIRQPKPFSHAECLFEIKHDGFRALCYIEARQVRLVSRNGNPFASFSELCEQITKQMPRTSAVLDGEIVCTDENGCSQFNQLLFRRGVPRFFAFDLLWLGDRDLRGMTLIGRKRVLRSLLPRQSDHLLYVDHVEGQGGGCLTSSANATLRASSPSIASAATKKRRTILLGSRSEIRTIPR